MGNDPKLQSGSVHFVSELTDRIDESWSWSWSWLVCEVGRCEGVALGRIRSCGWMPEVSVSSVLDNCLRRIHRYRGMVCWCPQTFVHSVIALGCMILLLLPIFGALRPSHQVLIDLGRQIISYQIDILYEEQRKSILYLRQQNSEPQISEMTSSKEERSHPVHSNE